MTIRLRIAIGLITATALGPTGAAQAQTLALPCLDTVVAGTVGTCPTPVPAPAPAPAPSPGCANADARPSDANLPAIRRATLCLLNVERRARGRAPLRFNRALAQAANGFALQMVQRQFFDHVSPAGTTLVQRIRLTSYLGHVARWSIGENLAWGGGELATPGETMRAWMNSAAHRRNILDRRFREVGVGVALGTPTGRESGATYATEFGRRS